MQFALVDERCYPNAISSKRFDVSPEGVGVVVF